MASNYTPQIFVDCLSDEEVQYELMLRKSFDSKDNKFRRKFRLKNAFVLEQAMAEEPIYSTKVDFDTDFSGAEIVFSVIKSMLEEENAISAETIKALKSHTVHLISRLKRMTPPDDHVKFSNMPRELATIIEKIEVFYSQLPDENFKLLNDSVPNEPHDYEFISGRQPTRSSSPHVSTNLNVPISSKDYTTQYSNLNSSAAPFTMPTYTTTNQFRSSAQQSMPSAMPQQNIPSTMPHANIYPPFSKPHATTRIHQNQLFPPDPNHGFLANLEQTISNLLDWKLSHLSNNHSN